MRFTIALAALTLGACSSFPAAEMRLPSELAQAQQRPISGITGWTHGRFQSGAYQGGYERSEERLVFFDTFDKRKAHAEFTVTGPEISSVIEARCWMREKAIKLGSASIITRPMAYSCDFLSDGRAFPARFELQEESRALYGALNQYQRVGEIALGGEVVQFRSTHKMVGTPLPTAAPIGYFFEQNGRSIGAIELNGKPRFIVAPGTDPGVERTMFIAAMALSLLWDPAESALGD